MTSNLSLPQASEVLNLAEHAALACGVDLSAHKGSHQRLSPITGTPLTPLAHSSADEVADAVERSHRAFLEFRDVPGPIRGNLIHRFSELLREHKDDLATLLTIEAGKITSRH